MATGRISDAILQRKQPVIARVAARATRESDLDEALPGIFDDLLAGFSEEVAIVDENWDIIAVNDAWKHMVRIAGYPELVPGTNYRGFLRVFADRGHDNAKAVIAGVDSIDAGETDAFQHSYNGVDEWAGRALQLRIHRLRIAGHVVATIARYDITDSVEVNRVRQDCTAAIINSEGEARERLTRELHDSTAQLLTSARLMLGSLKRAQVPQKADIDEIEMLLRQATNELRSMAYLSHPPDVARIGIVDALKALAEGFGLRAEMDISFEVVGSRVRVPLALKTAMYRIAQEGLSNVRRHARAGHARIALIFRKRAVHLIVADDGIGISDETLAGKGKAGVGIRGMRGRLAEIGGRLSVRRLRPGTAIVASIPLS